jgi:hypothetical protein
VDQGILTASTTPGWLASHTYNKGNHVEDPNGNIQVARTTTGTSGTVMPAWNTTPGVTTTDNTVTWVNAGPVATFALPSAGGTSGIIIDNFVGSGVLTGASQIYFSTLGNQNCLTSASTGGCAVQASQPALQ